MEEKEKAVTYNYTGNELTVVTKDGVITEVRVKGDTDQSRKYPEPEEEPTTESVLANRVAELEAVQANLEKKLMEKEKYINKVLFKKVKLEKELMDKDSEITKLNRRKRPEPIKLVADPECVPIVHSKDPSGGSDIAFILTIQAIIAILGFVIGVLVML